MPEDLVNREVGVVEVVVPPRSPLVGETVFPGMVRDEELVILAVSHHGNDTGPGPRARAGDALLLYGSWGAVDTLVDDRDIVVVDSPTGPTAGAARPEGTEAGVVLVAHGRAAGPGHRAAGGRGHPRRPRHGPHPGAHVLAGLPGGLVETVVLVGGLIPLSTAIQRSGAGDDIAQVVLDVVGTDKPVPAPGGHVRPHLGDGAGALEHGDGAHRPAHRLSAAAEGGVAVQPMLMLLAVAASAALLTPVQTPGNMMIMGPAGYRFGDYWKLGLPLLVLWLAVCLAVDPAVWPL